MNDLDSTTTPVKTCTKCGRLFPASPDFFYRQHDGKYGLRADCKGCFRPLNHRAQRVRYATQRAERLAHPAPIDTTGWPSCPYCGDPMRPKATSLGDRKRCSKLKCEKAYQRDRCRDWQRQYSDEHGIGYALTLNPDKRRESRRNNKASRRGVPGTHTTADERAQYDRQHGRCFYRKVNPECDVSLKDGYHVEHVIPMGGDRPSSNGPENIVLSCPKCNMSKGAKDPMDWAGIMF